jgi:CubicO group peptidase (beta-lactamase class C family)
VISLSAMRSFRVRKAGGACESWLTRALLFVSIAALLATADVAQSPSAQRLDGTKITAAEIDESMAQVMKGAKVPGVGLALLNGGKTVYVKGYGARDQEKNLPFTVDTVMPGASLSKAAFGYLVLQLVDEGILDLDKPVYQYLPKPLPDYPLYKDLANDPRYKRITARMLLSHTSGFPNWRRFDDGQQLKIHFEPGSRYAYSGEGIDLLQLIVETVKKEPLEVLMQKYVFEPFGMTHTSMAWREQFESNYANGYDENGQSLGPQKRKRADAAGSMQTTIGDFARFVEALMQGQRLKPQTRAQMLHPQIQITAKHQFPTFQNEPTEENKAIRLSYGLAWGLYWTKYGEAFFKEGHDDGWRNYAVCFDKTGHGMVIMTNSSNGEGIYKDLLERLMANNFTPIEWEGFTPYDQMKKRTP